MGLIQNKAHRRPGDHLCQVSQRSSSQAEEGAAVSKKERPLLQPMDISGHALQHQLVHLDHVGQSRRIWRPDTHVTPLQLSADTEPKHFVMALLAWAGSLRPKAWHTFLLLLISGSQLG